MKTFFYTLIISLIVSCASINTSKGSTKYHGKLLINQGNVDKFSFNISINLAKKDSIIQIKKPFYGNVLKIKVNEGKNLVFLPTKYSSPFYVPEEIDRNFKYWLRQCLLSRNLNIDDVAEELNFSFRCENIKGKTNFYITYEDIFIKGFLLKK